MKSNCFFRVIIFLFCLLTALPLRADTIGDAEAQGWVKDKGHQLLNTFGEPDLAKKYAQLDKMFVEFVDLDYVSRFVIGKYWRQMSESQKTSYQTLFKRYALSIYKSFPLNFDNNSIGFDIVKVSHEKNTTTVRAKINIQQQPNQEQLPVSDIFVDFILDKKDGNIRITDLKLGESSLILSYRSRFYEMIANDDNDIDWFLEDLTDITDAAERTNRQKLREAEY